MKKTLLFFVFVLIASLGFAQAGCEDGDCDGDNEGRETYNNYQSNPSITAVTKKINVLIYPNPATDLISFKEADGVDHILVFNLMGQVVRKFAFGKDQQYNIADLPQGIYLIQFLNTKNKILSTKRLKKIETRS